MKSSKIEKFIVPACILLFNLLFWSEKMGLNALLFTLVIIAVLLRKYKGGFTFPLIATTGGTLLAAVMVVLNNSDLSKVILLLSSFVMAGFFHRTDLKFIGFSFLSSLRQIISVPIQLGSDLLSNKVRGQSIQGAFSNYMVYGLIPTMVFGLFVMLYSTANDKFADLVFDYIGMIFKPTTGFSLFSFDQVMFFLLSVFVTGVLLLKPIKERFGTLQASCTDNLKRNKGKEFYFSTGEFTTLALKKEYQIGLIMMIALNVLLFVVNLTDIAYVWFNFEPMSPSELSKFVHDGTYILIISIFCAMAVLLYYFRGNINFLVGIKPLKYASLVWIIQNAILATSVGIRNYHYIREYGLASKRIGVLVFLVLTVIGLLLMWVKIRDRKSLYFLLDRNAWAVYGMLIFLTLFNWDGLMTRYNLAVNSDKPLDTYYLTDKLSDKNLPLLLEHEALIKSRSVNANVVNYAIELKKARFLRMQTRYTLLSWNYRDWQVKRYLKSRDK